MMSALCAIHVFYCHSSVLIDYCGFARITTEEGTNPAMTKSSMIQLKNTKNSPSSFKDFSMSADWNTFLGKLVTKEYGLPSSVRFIRI